MREIGIFAKHWTPGKVKTRLAASIGAAAASRLARVFLATLVRRFQGVGERRTLGFSPLTERTAFESLGGSKWHARPQSEGGLGARMLDFFAEAERAGAQRVVLIGADAPTLPRRIVDAAFAALQRESVVLGPSDDGGYYLIGVRGAAPAALFDDQIPWGTSQVWEQTLERAAAAGIRPAVLEPWYDVDEIEDLQRLFAELSDTASPDADRSFST